MLDFLPGSHCHDGSASSFHIAALPCSAWSIAPARLRQTFGLFSDQLTGAAHSLESATPTRPRRPAPQGSCKHPNRSIAVIGDRMSSSSSASLRAGSAARSGAARSRPLTEALHTLNAKAESFISRCTNQHEQDMAWLQSELRSVKARFTP